MTTIARLSTRLASGAATPDLLAEEALAAIADGAALGAFITVTAEEARRAAGEAALRWRSGTMRGPLDGIPVTIKDNLDLAGTRTTSGHADGPVAAADAAAVARLKAAGAIIVGKTNMDEGALGAVCDNPHHGRTTNPLAEGHTPGGSSGGAAVSVAAGMVPLAVGSDTLGSVRIPAAYCGLYALKPTAGAIARTGLAPLAESLDTVGLIAASAADLSTGLSILASFDPADPAGVPFAERRGLAGPRGPRLEVGLSTLPGTALDDAVADSLGRAALALASMGADMVPITVPGWDPARTRKDALLVIEAEAAMTHGGAIAADPARYGETFTAMVAYGAEVAAPRLAAAYATLRRAAAGVRHALREVDLILMPTTPQLSFPHAARAPASQGELTALANAAGLPSVQIPVPHRGGLPAGVQLIGPAWSEGWLIPLAGRLGDALAVSGAT
ncbi:glutamyl-tRNA (Gln) amidotransferase, A subunit [Stappia sp. 22II-S9-Z10]|nr:glutamyl-tRNA (Gln) amidotransferase, A subunit [Stappia sp. 22II-S9-Z10]